MKLLKTFGILVIVVAIFGGAMFGLNFYTGPIIEANNAGLLVLLNFRCNTYIHQSCRTQ